MQSDARSRMLAGDHRSKTTRGSAVPVTTPEKCTRIWAVLTQRATLGPSPVFANRQGTASTSSPRLCRAPLKSASHEEAGPSKELLHRTRAERRALGKHRFWQKRTSGNGPENVARISSFSGRGTGKSALRYSRIGWKWASFAREKPHRRFAARILAEGAVTSELFSAANSLITRENAGKTPARRYVETHPASENRASGHQ